MARVAKDKWDISNHKLGDIVGLLDKSEDGEIGIFVDEEFHSFDDIINNALGARIEIKFDNPIDEEALA